MDIKNIISEVVRELLPDVVRDVLRGELGSPGAKPGKKHSLPVQRLKRGPGRPAMAAEKGVKVGQRWKARSGTSFQGRIIEIANLGKEKILPKVVNSNGKRAVAKPISYGMLTKKYELVK